MLIRKRCNEFLVNAGKASKVLDEYCKVFALLFQISSQLGKDCLGIFTGYISTALNNLSRKAVEIVNKLGDLKIVAFQGSGKEGCLGIALLHYCPNDF